MMGGKEVVFVGQAWGRCRRSMVGHPWTYGKLLDGIDLSTNTSH